MVVESESFSIWGLNEEKCKRKCKKIVIPFLIGHVISTCDFLDGNGDEELDQFGT